MKILIADDDTLSLLLLRQTVEDWGYQVTTATDGNQACAILEGADAPMLAIIDGMMPGMDGIDVCRRVRQYNHDRYTYLIMLTARNETAFMVEAMNAGADDFISKPFNYEELQVRLRAGQRIIELEQQLRVKAMDLLIAKYRLTENLDEAAKKLSTKGLPQNRQPSSAARRDKPARRRRKPGLRRSPRGARISPYWTSQHGQKSRRRSRPWP